MEARDVDEETPLHLAIRRAVAAPDIPGHLIAIRGANINAQNIDGKTPLHIAVGEGTPQVARDLINLGADIDLADNDGRTPLHEAVVLGWEETARLLIARHIAGINVNALNKHGETPLQSAAGIFFDKGALEIMRMLVSKGADVKVLDDDKSTLLHRLCGSRWYVEHLEAAQMLVRHGLDINAQDDSGDTCLHAAASYRDVNMMRTLLGLGADAHIANSDGRYP
ncbi:ankyrin repeat-containing domain protein, partial [Schizophyllum commune]